MSSTAEDTYKFPDFTMMQHAVHGTAEWTISGAGGVVGTTDTDDPGITALVRTGAGIYTGTFPAVPAGSASGVQGRGRITPYIAKSAALTVVDAVITARSLTAGTFTLKTLNAAGSATDPADTDIIGCLFDLQFKPVP